MNLFVAAHLRIMDLERVSLGPTVGTSDHPQWSTHRYHSNAFDVSRSLASNLPFSTLNDLLRHV